MQETANEIILKGYPICSGIAIGKAFFFNHHHFPVIDESISAASIPEEIQRYRRAIEKSKNDIAKLKKSLENDAITDGVLILNAHLELLKDPIFTGQIEENISRTGKSANFVFQSALSHLQSRFKSIADPFFSSKVKDFEDLSFRILTHLFDQHSLPSISNLPLNSIVCTSELSTSDAAGAHPVRVCGFLTESGGATTHAAIIAKAKGIPFITDIKMDVLNEHQNSWLILDGFSGGIIINPSSSTLKHYRSIQNKIHFQSKSMEKIALLPSETFDGYPVKLYANLDMVHEIGNIASLGGEGIGLFRSEYLLLNQSEIPSEDEQYKIYCDILKHMTPGLVTIRTFDFGKDKSAFLQSERKEKNNSQHNRQRGLLSKEKNQLKTQLKAIVRASVHGNIRILLPMIATFSELSEAKQLVKQVQNELQINHTIALGCMIEVPSAALIADHFAKECDFLSIGTNDLIQYALAIDRNNQSIPLVHEPLDPSVLRLIKLITTEANKARIPVSVCGEMASDPRLTPLLLGLGIQELSVAPRYLPVIKNAIRHTSIVDAVRLSERALDLTTSEDVQRLITNHFIQIDQLAGQA